MRIYVKKARSLIILLNQSLEKFLTRVRSAYRDKIIPALIKKRVNDGVLAVDIRNNNGLGSKLTWVLLLLAYCEEKKLKLAIRFSYPKVSKDFFQHYFQLKGKHSAKDHEKYKYTIINSITEVSPEAGDDSKLTLKEACDLVKKYIAIKPEIITSVDEYILKYMNNHHILGLHYRGTDKGVEAEIIDYKKVYDNILFYCEAYGIPDKLFVSTDCANFLSYIDSVKLPFQVVYRDTDTRSVNQKAVHFGINTFENALLINEEALINCLILSRCSFLLKSSSFLSDWAKLFNPNLGVTVLNKPYDWALWFPGRALIENNAFEPI